MCFYKCKFSWGYVRRWIHTAAWLHTRRWSFLSSGCVLCVCESAAGQHHHWHSDKSLISRLLLSALDIAGRSNDRGSTQSLRGLTVEVIRFIWVQSHQHICYRWLVRTCVCACHARARALTFFFLLRGRKCICQGGEGGGERVRGERIAACVGGTRGFSWVKKKKHYTNKAAKDEICRNVLVSSAKDFSSPAPLKW